MDGGGRADGQTGGRMGGRMGGRTGGRTSGRMGGRTGGRAGRRAGGRTEFVLLGAEPKFVLSHTIILFVTLGAEQVRSPSQCKKAGGRKL